MRKLRKNYFCFVVAHHLKQKPAPHKTYRFGSDYIVAIWDFFEQLPTLLFVFYKIQVSYRTHVNFILNFDLLGTHTFENITLHTLEEFRNQICYKGGNFGEKTKGRSVPKKRNISAPVITNSCDGFLFFVNLFFPSNSFQISTNFCFFAEEKVDLSSPEWSEIHLVAGALKMFLRELPEPVLPFRYFNEFISSCRKFLRLLI